MLQTLIVLLLLALSLHCVFASTVTGTVVRMDGKPIEGANVHLDFTDARQPLDQLSDTKGNFSFEIEEDLSCSNIPVAKIMAFAPGYAPDSAMLKRSGNVIMLSLCAKIGGTVVDIKGRPLAGVPVRLCNWGDRMHLDYRRDIPEEWRTCFTAVSTTEGTWTLSGIPLSGTATFALDDDRYVRDEQFIYLQFVAGEQAEPVHFIARPGATVTGRILTPEGKPATDAEVSCSTSADFSPVKTMADGSYRIAGLETGSYTIRAWSKTQAWIADPLMGIVLTAGKETAAPDLHTHAGAVLEGTIVDAATGTPIPGTAIMSLYKGHPLALASARFTIFTVKNGHFFIRTQPAQHTLLINDPPPGYLPQPDAEAIPVELQEGQTVTMTLKLHKGLSVTGTVTGDDGTPAAGAEFTIFFQDTDNARYTSINFTTDQHGYFTVTGLPMGEGNIDYSGSFYADAPEWDLPTALDIDIPTKDADCHHYHPSYQQYIAYCARTRGGYETSPAGRCDGHVRNG